MRTPEQKLRYSQERSRKYHSDPENEPMQNLGATDWQNIANLTEPHTANALPPTDKQTQKSTGHTTRSGTRSKLASFTVIRAKSADQPPTSTRITKTTANLLT